MIAALVLTGGVVYAQQEAGDSELMVNGSLSLAVKNRDFTSDTGNIFLSYGYFLNPTFEVGGTFITGLQQGPDMYSVGPFIRLNFASGKLVPYVGSAFTFTRMTGSGDFESTNWERLDFDGGIRYFFRPNIAFVVSGAYGYSFPPEPLESDWDDTFSINLGLSFIWGH
jgi:hypothetical protein